ncbi:MAG: GNAT family N-acetyltransferase [Actinomycetia bacterium]|jgi:GNAT superfamily N-acetyltransferase|nr:GNAT family N-acetyltransferase [Actinomycetes bacterium]
MPTIRPVQPDDLVELHAMVRELAEYERSLEHVRSTPEDFRLALFGPNPALFGHVVDCGTELGGFAVWFVNFSTWSGRHGIYLEDLYVRPHLRGQGLGRDLLAELARTCVARGYARLEWWVLDWNEPARRFYASLGAQPMEEWTVHRVSGGALDRLAEGTPAAGSAQGGRP